MRLHYKIACIIYTHLCLYILAIQQSKLQQLASLFSAAYMRIYFVLIALHVAELEIQIWGAKKLILIRRIGWCPEFLCWGQEHAERYPQFLPTIENSIAQYKMYVHMEICIGWLVILL